VGNSFKDQFLKKGLVTKKQANKAINEKNVSRSKKRNKKTREDDEIQRRIQLARNEQSARNRELNRQRNEVAKEKEVQGQIRQIIKQNRIETEGDISYHFVDGKKIKKLYVAKEIVDGLSKGRMAIVKQDEHYVVVPAKAACQIQDRKTESLILLNSQVREELDPDDPYAEFPIPDDYEW
jgi:uncharacterized protein YaiL (DUF2058 family)